jgi:hypothetical protein
MGKLVESFVSDALRHETVQLALRGVFFKILELLLPLLVGVAALWLLMLLGISAILVLLLKRPGV